MSVEGVILAAGLSTRAKTYKMTLEVGDKTVIERVIDSMLDVCSRVIVVGGYKIEKLKPIVEKYKNVILVNNEEYEKGMYSSIQRGFAEVKSDWILFTPGDYPLIDKEVCSELIKHTSEHVVIPTYDGKKGHPILMKNIIVREIAYTTKYSNLREALSNKDKFLVPVNNKGILMDLDTMEDYDKILEAK